jgi:hypothetical protein
MQHLMKKIRCQANLSMSECDLDEEGEDGPV